MREVVSVSPAVWLASGPIVIQNSASVLATFNPGTVKVVRFTGPHTLYRAGGWDSIKGQLASAYGSWWADAVVLANIGRQLDKFENWLPTALIRQAWPAQYRGVAALCEDWNYMREMFRLELPVKDEIFGLVGLAAPQPQLSKMNPKARTTPMFKGGGEQVYFKKTFTLNSVNPLWVYQTHLW
jgi:hypothetical protein